VVERKDGALVARCVRAWAEWLAALDDRERQRARGARRQLDQAIAAQAAVVRARLALLGRGRTHAALAQHARTRRGVVGAERQRLQALALRLERAAQRLGLGSVGSI
jgi:hypothetical protein